MTIATLGIDLARNVFALHGVDAAGKPVLARPNVTRRQLMELVAGLSPCLIGMEACSGAHHRARAFSAHGGLSTELCNFVSHSAANGTRSSPNMIWKLCSAGFQ